MKVSDILTLVAVLTAGASAYFAYDSWEKYTGKPFDDAARSPSKFRYTKAASTRAPLVPTRISRENELKNQQSILSQEQTTLADTTKTRDGLLEDNKVLAEEILKATTQKQELQETIREKTRVITDNSERIRQLEEATAVTGNPDELKSTVQENIRRLNDANAALAKEKDTLAAALKMKEELEARLAAARLKESMQLAGEMDPGFRSTVREVFSRWGFVVINGGAAAGVNARTKLEVRRGGMKIADLQVTTVEPKVAVCGIVPGSLQADMNIAPGDTITVAPVTNPAPPVVESTDIPVSNPAPAAPAAPEAAADPFGGINADPLPEAAPATDPAGF